MGGWIAEVHQHPVAQILGNMAVIAGDDLATGSLIGAHPGMIVFRVQLLGERRRAHQVNEHHRQLTPFTWCELGARR